MKQKRVFVLSSPAGCGKTTWVKKQIAEHGGIHVSRDEVRFSMVSEDEDYFAHEDEVFAEWIRQCQEAIDDDVNEDIYIDATHLTDKARANTVNRLEFDTENVSLICVRFNVPIEVCKYRNSLRQGRAKVPEDVINKMYQRYSYPILHPTRHQQWCAKFEEVWEVDAAGDTRKYASWRTD